MERLTEKQKEDFYTGKGNDLYDILVKLGKLEDIMEKYGIESVEDLENKIIHYEENKDVNLGLRTDIKKLEQDRDTWKKACELACEKQECDGCVCLSSCHGQCIYEPSIIANYFYQQAQKEMKE